MLTHHPFLEKIVGTIINVMTENMRHVRLALQENLFGRVNSEGHNGFLHDFPVI